MPTFTASIATAQTVGVAASTRPESRDTAGKLRYMFSTITVPAGTAIADVIQWGKLPKGSRLIGHLSKLYFAAGAASSTLNLGDATTPARYLAATSVATAGSAVPEAAAASGAGFVNTGDTMLQSVVAGAGLQAGQVITLHAAYVQD